VKIACVGGGPAGLYLSILMKLRDPEHEVTVFERSKANSTSGWGVTFGLHLKDRLYAEDPESAEQIRASAFCWHDQIAHIRGEQAVAHGGDGYNISRRRLINILTARALALGVRIEYGTEITDLDQLPEADLVALADGVSSKIRTAAGGFKTETVAGENKYIWLGSDKIFEAFNFLFTQTAHGWIWAHAYGIDAESSTFIVECSARTWTGLGFDTMSTSEALPVLEGLFSEHLDGRRLIGELGDGSTARWLNFKTISNVHWHSGNVVLVGDSARTAHFAIGMGTTLAIEDVMLLADLLHREADLEAALDSYERQRKSQLVATLGEARCSARWLENLDRYAHLTPQKFGVLFYARRSPLIAALPPRLSYLLRQASGKIKAVDAVRDSVAPVTKAIYNRRKPVEPAQEEDGGASASRVISAVPGETLP
jgi:2-polyprenyl-6-methoxyphenol hydroxylase-like FAD-dependent oxidoreductase